MQQFPMWNQLKKNAQKVFGFINPVIPNTNKILNIFEPIIFPMTIIGDIVGSIYEFHNIKTKIF